MLPRRLSNTRANEPIHHGKPKEMAVFIYREIRIGIVPGSSGSCIVPQNSTSPHYECIEYIIIS